MTDTDRKEQKIQWERRAQSIMLGIATSAILWALQATLESRTDLAGIKPRLDAIDIQLSATYRASDAHRDVDALTSRIASGERRIEGVEQRLGKVEDVQRDIARAPKGHL